MLTIALVDDDPSVRIGLGRLLTARGYKVALFTSAEEFLRQVPGDRPDCLVLDRQLDGMSGDELLKELVARRFVLPTILISGKMLDDFPEKAEDLVIRLKKPFSAAALFAAIDALVDPNVASR